MAVNPFTKPAKTGKFVPIESPYPAKKEAQVTRQLKKQYDTARRTDSAAQRMVDNIETADFEGDKKLKDAVSKEIKKRIEERAEQGDYENMMRQVREDAATTQGLLKPIREHKKKVQQWSESVDKVEMNEADKRRWKQMIMDNYKRQQGGLDFNEDTLEVTGGQFSGKVPSKDVNMVKKLDELTTGWKSSGQETIQYVGEDGIYKTIDIEKASEPAIRQAAMTALQNDPDVQAFLEDRSDLEAYSSGSNLDRYRVEREVKKTDKDGEVVAQGDEPITETTTAAEALIGETVSERVNRYKEKFEEQGIDSDKAREQAKQETYKDLYKKEKMASAAGFVTSKQGFIDIDRNLAKLDLDEEDEGPKLPEPTPATPTHDYAVFNPYMDEDFYKTVGGKKKWVPEQETFWNKFTEDLSKEFNDHDDIGKSPGDSSEITQKILNYVEGVAEAPGLIDIGESVSEGLKANDKYTDKQAEMMGRARTIAEKSLIMDLKDGKLVQTSDGSKSLRTSDVSEIQDKELYKDILKDRTQQVLNNVATVNTTEFQLEDTEVLKDAEERLLEQKQAGQRDAYMYSGSGDSSRKLNFSEAWSKLKKNTTGIPSEMSISKARDKGLIAISGTVGPDDPNVAGGWNIRATGGDSRIVVKDKKLADKNRVRHKINRSIYKLEPVDITIPEDFDKKTIEKVKSQFDIDQELEPGNKYKFLPIPRRTEDGGRLTGSWGFTIAD